MFPANEVVFLYVSQNKVFACFQKGQFCHFPTLGVYSICVFPKKMFVSFRL